MSRCVFVVLLATLLLFARIASAGNCLVDLGAFSDGACSIPPPESKMPPQHWEAFRYNLLESGECALLVSGYVAIRVDCDTEVVEIFNRDKAGPYFCNETAPDAVVKSGECANLTTNGLTNLGINYLSPTVKSGAGLCAFKVKYHYEDSCEGPEDRVETLTNYDRACLNLTQIPTGKPASIGFNCKDQLITIYNSTDDCSDDAVGLVYRAGECVYDDVNHYSVFTMFTEGSGAGSGSRLSSWFSFGFDVLRGIVSKMHKRLEKATNKNCR